MGGENVERDRWGNAIGSARARHGWGATVTTGGEKTLGAERGETASRSKGRAMSGEQKRRAPTAGKL